jgi:hypothetical protein
MSRVFQVTKNTFYSLIWKSDMKELELPLNLPQQFQRVPGTVDQTAAVFENTLLIKRPTELYVADPRLNLKVKSRRRQELLSNPAPCPSRTTAWTSPWSRMRSRTRCRR